MNKRNLLAMTLLFVAFASSQLAIADFKYCNKTSIPLHTAIGYNKSGEWYSEGWWTIQSGACATVIAAGDLRSRYYYTYAENLSYDYTSDGNYNFCVQQKAFTLPGNACSGSSRRRVGFDQTDTEDYSGYTVNFTCSSCPKEFWSVLKPFVGKHRECRQTMDCRQTQECRACLLRNPLNNNCIQHGNDPICEARKSARKLDCERRKTGRKLDCERLKATQIAVAEITEAAIHESKKQMRGTSLRRIPSRIRQDLRQFFHEDVLDRVRFTTDWKSLLSLSNYALDWGGKGAIVFDYIIVFRNEDDARYNVGLWAHELEHVKQYSKFGIDGFAQFYTHASNRIESGANRQEEYVCRHLRC